MEISQLGSVLQYAPLRIGDYKVIIENVYQFVLAILGQDLQLGLV